METRFLMAQNENPDRPFVFGPVSPFERPVPRTLAFLGGHEAISGHKWQCGPGGTGIIYIRNRQHAANPTPLPRFHLIRSSARDVPFDGSRPADFDIGAAMSRYGFPESADWRALGDVDESGCVVA